MTYRGKIVLAPYPFDDFSDSKPRPILCLTDPIGPNFHVIGAYITSQKPDSMLLSDFVIDPALPEWLSTGLKVVSYLRAHRLTTFDISIARRTIGFWPIEKWPSLEIALRELLRL